MNKYKPDLQLYIAESILKERYTTEYTPEKLEKLINYIHQHLGSTKRIMQLYLKTQRLYINMLLVDTFLLELSDKEKKLLYYYYKEQQNYEWISQKLFFAKNTVFRTHQTLLEKVAKLFSFHLDPDDVFCRLRIINLLHIIDLRIESLSAASKIIQINMSLLNRLKTLRHHYRVLLDKLNSVLADEKNKHITIKIKSPYYSVSEIANECGMSVSSVSRDLKCFSNTLCAV